MTRKQAEQRALALYPIRSLYSQDHVNTTARHAYLKCWEDLKAAPKLRYLRTPSKNQNADHSL